MSTVPRQIYRHSPRYRELCEGWEGTFPEHTGRLSPSPAQVFAALEFMLGQLRESAVELDDAEVLELVPPAVPFINALYELEGEAAA
jgi:hypothetical protein